MYHIHKIILKMLFVFICAPQVAYAAQTLSAEEQNTIGLFKRAAPYVVNVHRYLAMTDGYNDLYEVPMGSGSGFIWDKTGRVVTNYHVVRGSQKFAVTLQNGKVVAAKVVGIAPQKDIALLQLEATKEIPAIANTHPMPIADSSTLQVGQKTIAIGNPFGLDRTLTTGIISALGRGIPGVGGVKIHDMIQTDASINPGNSCGPLLNSTGELIGMTTMIYSKSGTSAGIGFAVPSNTIKRIVDQLIQFGKVIQPGLGIQSIPDSVAAQLGVQGVIVADVLDNSPADKAGIQASTRDNFGNIRFGDVIMSVDGKRVKSFDDLHSILDEMKIGQNVELEILRNNKIKKVKLTLAQLSEMD